MRKDSIGLFWEDLPAEKGAAVRKRPKVPKTGWKTPTEFPNLSSCKVLGIDTETYDPELLTHGPGWARGVGEIVGISIAADKNNAWYFPIRHTDTPKDNMHPGKVLQWLQDVLGTEGVTKIGANIQYDLGWLRQSNVMVSGPFIDVLHAEALIDESRFKYDLDSIANKYLSEKKKSNKLYKWCARFYGGNLDQSQRKNIYRAPPSLVGPYAISDAILPFRIYQKQKKILSKEKLLNVFDLECRLIPLMLDMRFRGVRVNVERAEKARDDLKKRETELHKKLKKITGKEININASASIAKAFDKEGLTYPYTKPSKTFPNGKPSFVAAFLNNHPHPIANLIVMIRQAEKARSTFIENYILEKNINGRLYCEFPQLKGDSGGTGYGRFSSRNPNLQNIPARDPVTRDLIRGCFIPDDLFEHWGRLDLSQIEYRFLAHHAVGLGSKVIRKKYKKDHSTDFHQATSDMIFDITNMSLDRKPTKTINFGLVYGMGKGTLQQSLGLDTATTRKLMDAYHESVPFVKETFNYYSDKAQKNGVIKTILGRRSRFNLWERRGSYANVLPYKDAVRKFGYNIQRAYTHKALNRLLQGGAADFMKMGMVKAYEAGIFDALGGPPHLTVHDELDFSFNKDSMEAVQELILVMNNAIPLKVPVQTVFEHGKNWAQLK